MDRCEEDVIIACGLYLLAEEEKKEKKNRQKFFKYFRMSF